MEIQQIRLALCEDVNFARPNATVSRNRSHAVNRLEIELGDCNSGSVTCRLSSG
jgi:hypothetical protein